MRALISQYHPNSFCRVFAQGDQLNLEINWRSLYWTWQHIYSHREAPSSCSAPCIQQLQGEKNIRTKWKNGGNAQSSMWLLIISLLILVSHLILRIIKPLSSQRGHLKRQHRLLITRRWIIILMIDLPPIVCVKREDQNVHESDTHVSSIMRVPGFVHEQEIDYISMLQGSDLLYVSGHFLNETQQRDLNKLPQSLFIMTQLPVRF